MENLTQQQASRFLDLATMGVKQSELEQFLLLDDRGRWIEEQINQPYTKHLDRTRYQANSRGQTQSNQDCRVGAWFDIALGDAAQLRQRVAFALSQNLCRQRKGWKPEPRRRSIGPLLRCSRERCIWDI
ncbi:hypothetical protein ACVT98_15915 [Vibrio campbellii]